MTTHFLPIHRDNALLEVEELLPELSRGALDFKRLLFVAEQYRIAAICDLFLGDDAARPLRWLHDAASAFAHGLAPLKARGERVVLSRCLPLFDALACRDDRMASRLADLLHDCPFDADVEYEEDHLYVRWIAALVRGEEPARRGPFLERFEELSPGDPRLALCRALDAVDPAAFDEALDELLEAHRARYRKLEEDEAIAPEVAASVGRCSIEGAAFVQLARARGLATQPDYALVPSTLTSSPTPAYDPESWRTGHDA